MLSFKFQRTIYLLVQGMLCYCQSSLSWYPKALSKINLPRKWECYVLERTLFADLRIS